MTLQHKILGQLNVDSLVETPTIEPIGFPIFASSSTGMTSAFSTNATTWTQTSLPNPGSVFNGYRYVNYVNDKFIAFPSATSNTVGLYSSNGVTWTLMTMPASGKWRSVAYGNDTYVAVRSGSSTSNVGVSTNGINWTVHNGPVAAGLSDVVYAQDKFVAAVGYRDYATYSTDGTSWQNATLPASLSWRHIAYGNGVFAIIGNSSTSAAAYSTDAITWTQSTLPSSLALPSQQELLFKNNIFVTIDNAGKVITSTDGISWVQSTTLTNSVQWRDIAYGQGRFVAIAYGNPTSTYATSTNGTSWITADLGISGKWEAIAYGEASAISLSYDPKTIYTVPANTETIVTSIFVSNTSASSDTYDLAVIPNGETLSDVHYIRKSVELAGNDFNTVETKLTLSAGDQIVAKSLYNNIQINIFGVEKS